MPANAEATTSEATSTPALDKLKKENQKSEVKQFIRTYQLKQQAFKELAIIYANQALTPHFALTFKAAVALIVLPALTNIYYALRPHSTFAGILPFAVPLLCLSNYIYFMSKDFQNFCFTLEPDAAKARDQFNILYQFSFYNRRQNEFMLKLQNFRKDTEEKVERE